MTDQRPTITDHEFVHVTSSTDPFGAGCQYKSPLTGDAGHRCEAPVELHRPRHAFKGDPCFDDPLGQFCGATAPWGRCGRPFDVHPGFAMAPGAVGLAAPRPAPHPSDRGEAL